MVRGRKPTPSHLHLVNGNPGKRKRNAREAIVLPSEPMPPPHLSDLAKVEWGRLMPELIRCGLISTIDRAAFAVYCQAYGRWVQAEQALQRMADQDPNTHALMIRTTSKNAIQNPLVGAANRAAEIMMRAAAEFGLTPSARTRIHADIPKDPAAVQANGTTGKPARAKPPQGPDRFF